MTHLASKRLGLTGELIASVWRLARGSTAKELVAVRTPSVGARRLWRGAVVQTSLGGLQPPEPKLDPLFPNTTVSDDFQPDLGMHLAGQRAECDESRSQLSPLSEPFWPDATRSSPRTQAPVAPGPRLHSNGGGRTSPPTRQRKESQGPPSPAPPPRPLQRHI